jgi:hypothetical protein
VVEWVPEKYVCVPTLSVYNTKKSIRMQYHWSTCGLGVGPRHGVQGHEETSHPIIEKGEVTICTGKQASHTKAVTYVAFVSDLP